MIVVAAGLQKSGTGWYFNLTNDLLVTAGYQDVRQVRDKYHLQSVIKYQNCHFVRPTLLNFMRLSVPHFLGNTFVVKFHQGPRLSLRCFIASSIAKATYIYRDPRDAALSAFEFGQRLRGEGMTHSFARLKTMKQAIVYTNRRLAAWDKWTQSGLALLVRYESLLADPAYELERLVDYLSLRVSPTVVQQIAGTYQKDKVTKGGKRDVLHFNQGVVGRFRKIMNAEELSLCEQYFGGYLEKMGYSKE